MGDASLKQFVSKIATDSRLQDQLKNLTEKGAFTETVVRLGHESGFEFIVADEDACLAKHSKRPCGGLSEADLELVAGGQQRQGAPANRDGRGGGWGTQIGRGQQPRG